MLQGLIRRIDSPYVFVDQNGRRFKEVKRSFATACRKAGLKDFHFHDLRHTFASQLVMAGVDLITVKELLGHKSIAMTLRYATLHQAIRSRLLKVSVWEMATFWLRFLQYIPLFSAPSGALG